jgi:dTDP-4-amino-4,6-dideoxygalactose transaminase
MDAVTRVVDSQQFILGEEVESLEAELAPYCGAPYAVACASGSDALSLALMEAGIQPGDEVLTVPFTFFSTAGEIVRCGAKPAFIDIEPQTFNMDMNQARDALKKRSRLRAVIPVHLFGGCADMDPLLTATAERELVVIEDAAQSIGSEYKGRRAGSMGDLACFSFFPTKNLGGYGDGGMLTTRDPKRAARLKALRVHGRTHDYFHEWAGVNSRLDALQAAVLRVKFRYLDEWTQRRQENAQRYRELLADGGLPVTAPEPALYQNRHVYNQFVIRCADRDRLQAYLKQHGVGTAVYYPLSLHLQPCFAGLGYKKGDFPVSEQVSAEVLALPVNPEVSLEDVAYVCEMIRAFYRS